MTSGMHAKEIRLFNLGGLFKERFQTLQRALREEKLALARRRSFIDLIAQTVVTGATFGSFAFICYQAIGGAITLGGLVMYYQGFQLGISSFQSFLRGLAGLYEDNLFLSNFYQFLELTPKVRAPAQPRQVPEPMREGIAFESVRFTYPSQKQQVLTEIDLSLAPGQVIALVGENGAGKTTLIKLLCRLYDPDAGRITVDGIDLRDLDPTHWRRQISVVFQDYVHYFMAAWENIWLGNVEKEPDREAIAEAARLSGADALIRRLPRGYDTMLGTEFEQGHELSIGEWQKVALARAFLRDSRIVVLDEPTSSLDPLAEADLFRKFRQLIQGRSAILISHRFSTVRYADTIYVVKDGRISEHGAHEDLLGRAGDYARLFTAQAQNYN
jgi:ATP-binding cassette subfamily B protein